MASLDASLSHASTKQGTRRIKSFERNGVLRLPGITTLKEYSGSIRPEQGFNEEVLSYLKKQADKLKEGSKGNGRVWVPTGKRDIRVHSSGTVKSNVPHMKKICFSEKNMASHSIPFTTSLVSMEE